MEDCTCVCVCGFYEYEFGSAGDYGEESEYPIHNNQ